MAVLGSPACACCTAVITNWLVQLAVELCSVHMGVLYGNCTSMRVHYAHAQVAVSENKLREWMLGVNPMQSQLGLALSSKSGGLCSGTGLLVHEQCPCKPGYVAVLHLYGQPCSGN